MQSALHPTFILFSYLVVGAFPYPTPRQSLIKKKVASILCSGGEWPLKLS